MLLQMADFVYNDEYSNVLLFVLYLSKDTELIQQLIKLADQIYGDKEPCNMDSHVAFANTLDPSWMHDLLPDPNVQANRQEDRRKQDEFDEEALHLDAPND